MSLPLPPLSTQEPFTVTATLYGRRHLFGASTPVIASEVAHQWHCLDPHSRPDWGPSATPDAHPWPTTLFLRSVQDPPLHVALVSSGYTLPEKISTCCQINIERVFADVTGRGSPCAVCLSYWNAAHHDAEFDGEAVRQEWPDLDMTQLDRLLQALRRL